MSKADSHRQPRPANPPPPPATPVAASPVVPVHIPPDVAPKPPSKPPKTSAASRVAATPAKAAPASPSTVKSTRSPAAPTAITSPIAVRPPDEPPPDVAESALKGAPPFLVSLVVHTVLIIVLALITLTKKATDQLQLQAVYYDQTGEQLLNDTLQSPEALDMQVESPMLSAGLTPVDDPLSSPPKLPDFFDRANSALAKIDAPNIGMALQGREVGMKKALLPISGGSETTEAAVRAGLEWLKKQQQRDGGWSLVGPYPDGSLSENRCAATAMALLAFQGYGATHIASATTPDYHEVVERGWNFLLKMLDKDGFFQHEGNHNHRMYAQAQATIALCEIYGMTKDAKFKRPAQLALEWAHRAQSPELGGWRYDPRIDSDTSVTGWYVMAFQSGMMAGLEVQSPSLDLVNRFLDRVQKEGGSQYSYQVGEEPRLTMTAEGLLCRQYLGWKHDDPRLRAGIDLLLANTIDYEKDMNVYYWYYATQACHHMDGDDWNRWNEVLRTAVPARQIKTGSQRGSWDSVGDKYGSHGGRLYTTCLSVFMLETYYRHLPIYKWRVQ